MPYQGLVDVFIYNPDGHLQRRYPALHSNFGVVSVGYQLAPELKFGNWKVKARIGANSAEIEFPVEEFSEWFIASSKSAAGRVIQFYDIDPKESAVVLAPRS